MTDSLDERYRKFLQTVLIHLHRDGSDKISLNVPTIQELMKVPKEEAELYYNIFNYTTKFLDVLKKTSEKQSGKMKVDATLDLSMNELISFSDFSILSAKVPLMEKDFVKSEYLVRIKQKYPFLFRFINGKWQCSSIGENIGKEFKSFSKMNMIPPKLVLENMVINIAEQ